LSATVGPVPFPALVLAHGHVPALSLDAVLAVAVVVAVVEAVVWAEAKYPDKRGQI